MDIKQRECHIRRPLDLCFIDSFYGTGGFEQVFLIRDIFSEIIGDILLKACYNVTKDARGAQASESWYRV